MDGFLLIDKDKGLTSFDVVAKVRKITSEKRVGHAGTLDPLATGLLILALGQGTKILEYLVGFDKEYEVIAEFGKESDTYDADGEIEIVDDETVFTSAQVEKVIKKKFLGNIKQIPPKYSALKVRGEKACDIMRKGGNVDLGARDVKIFAFKPLKYQWPYVFFRIKCGSGTYVRSLIHNLGEELGCGAYVKGLRRIKVGNFSVKDASKLENIGDKTTLTKSLISVDEIASKFKQVLLNAEEIKALKDGKTLMSKKIDQDDVAMAFKGDKFLGVLEPGNGGKGVKFRKAIVEK